MITLDVGSGHYPRGDVNVDLFDRYAHYSPNFVKAEACHLPFKNRTFTSTTCFHVIEHVPNPAQLMKELIRVTYGTIILKTPYRNIGFNPAFGKSIVGTSRGKAPHKWSFSKKWFLPIQKVYPKTEIDYSQFFIVPIELTVEIDTTVKDKPLNAEHVKTAKNARA